MENPLMDKYQVAEHIGGITPRAAARLMKSMPCINMGSSEARPRLRVYQSDLLDWLEQRKMIRAAAARPTIKPAKPRIKKSAYGEGLDADGHVLRR